MRNRTPILTIVLLMCAAIGSAAAQKNATATLHLNEDAIKPSDLSAALKASADQAASDLVKLKKANPAAPIQLDIGEVVSSYLAYIAGNRTARKAAETSRTDKQISASSSSTSGSTSLIDKPGIAQLLGFAVEHGAITQSVQNNTVTFSTSPYAFAAWFSSGDTAENYQKYGDTYGRVGISANFNLSDATNPALSATRKQLNEWTGRIRLLGDHSSRTRDAQAIFDRTLKVPLQTLANDQSAILDTALGGDASYLQMKTAIFNSIQQHLQDNPNADDSTKSAAISKIISDGVISGMQNFSPNPATLKKLAQLASDYGKAADLAIAESKEMNDAIAELAKKASLTFVYAQEQPAGGNNYSVLKLVFAKGPKDGMQLTINASGSLYHHPITTKNQDTFRDFSASVEWSQNLGRSPFLLNPVNKDPIIMAFSGRYQRMPENKGVAGKKADIAVAGAKFQIPVAPGVSFPLSVTYANATELIKEAHVSGNFGITFDLDKLKALVSK